MLRPTLLALTLLACGTHAPTPPPPPPPQSDAPWPSIVVTIVVDQLAGWVAEERLRYLPPTGGFARLRREGTWAVDMRYAHSVTDTAPGHAALFTGLPPRDTGIYANEKIDAETRKAVSILRDPRADLIGPRGATPKAGASIAALSVDTVADKLRAKMPSAFIAGLSYKDRGAIFGCGRKADACLWYEASAGGFVTSSAFASALPTWTLPMSALDDATKKPWTLVDRDFIEAHAHTRDDQPGEGTASLGATFPKKPASQTQAPLQALRYTPEADRLLFDLALRAIDASGQRAALVSISLSTFDYVGHVWGADSWESWEELARLDAALGTFFAALDARVGAEGWAALLTADHGMNSMPEVKDDDARPWCKTGAPPDRLGRACSPLSRVIPADLATELTKVAEQALGPGDWILGVVDPYVYFTTNTAELPKGKREALEKAIVDHLLARHDVARVVPRGRRASCPSGEDLDATMCQALTDATPDGLYIALKPGSFFDAGHAVGKGASHGSPYAYDRSVPLFVRAPGRAPANAVIQGEIPYQSFARTLCALLDLEPITTQGRDLTRAK